MSNKYFENLQSKAKQSIAVLPELPRNRVWNIYSDKFHPDLKMATQYTDGQHTTFHWCDCCNGWVKDALEEQEINNLSPQQLAGRKGTAYVCGRCTYEISFVGLVS
jgi:hypothetical protein